jgi:predicted ATPase
VAGVEKQVCDTRLVTLTGPGVGKTRLALEVSRRLTEDFADGLWFCDLAAVSDPEAVAGAVAATLAIQRQHGRSISDRLVEVFGGRRALLGRP